MMEYPVHLEAHHYQNWGRVVQVLAETTWRGPHRLEAVETNLAGGIAKVPVAIWFEVEEDASDFELRL